MFNAASQYGLKFYDASSINIIHPATTAGGDKDASVSLGYSSSRFKDLYLSGTVKANGIAATDVDLTISNSADGIYFGSGFFRPYTADDNIISLGSSTARFKDLHLAGTIGSGAITSTGDITTNSTTHAYVIINSSATTTASWLYHKQGGTLRWLSGVEGSQSDWQLYSTNSGNTGTRLRVTADGNATFSGSVTSTGLTVNTTSDSDSITTITSSATSNNTQLRLGTSGNDSVISGSGGSNGGLKFKVYGSEKMAISSAGNVNIPNGKIKVSATTAPVARVDIAGNSDTVPALKIGSGDTYGHFFYDSSATGDLVIKRGQGGAQSESMRLDRSTGNATFSGMVTANTGIQIDALNLDGRTIASTDTNGNINIHPNGSGTVNVSTSLMVGATTAPAYPLEISNSSSLSFAYQRTGVSAKKWGFDSDNAATYWVNLTDNVRPLTLLNAGNVGIGTLSPTEKLEVAGTALVENAKLKAIAESNTQTAIDVFVYDTRKDSDGGAWRKRTQHTSWYSEASDTRRGTRKDFPAVAVIVAHAAGVTIYDGDDPDMPMWMYIYAGYSHNFSIGFSQNGAPTAVTARDGVIYTTTNGGAQDNSVNGLFAHNFVSDRMYQWNVSGGFGYYPMPIEGRDSGGSLAYHESKVGYDATKKLVSAYLTDVSVTVLPNAPIDAATGLPVPTIAVATQSGISIIKDTGTVVDITVASGGYTHITDVDVSPDGWVAWSHNDTRSAKAAPIPEQDKAYGFWTYNDGAYNFYESHAFATNLGNVPALVSSAGGITDHILGKVVVSSDGLTLLGLQKNYDVGVFGDADMPLSAYITSEYNTGWMMSGIKLATLSDTDTTNATSANQAANGNFADTSVWGPANGASFSVSGNVGTITGNGSTTQAYIGQTVSGLTVGKQYMITCDAKRGTTSAAAAITVNSILSAMTSSTSFAPLHVTFTATATSQLVLCFMNGTGSQSGTALFQNFTFRLAEADRSVNGASPHGGNALQVFGTVTKTAVATGAELVGYSGFSTSNYLQQPNNSDFEFGTGNWSMTGWISQTGTASTQHPIQLGLTTGSSSEISILRQTSSGAMLLGFRVRGDSGSYAANPVGGLINPNVWTHFVLTKSGSQLLWYINGKLLHSAASSTVGNIGFSSSDILRIGHGASTVTADVMKLALLRISATAPSLEQIKKMYNDEKHLFATNAKATIYGTSNNTSAIAYDDSTELLHVGTSAGRSEFQGLNRVNNTTDAVGTAISASNGFIVEE